MKKYILETYGWQMEGMGHSLTNEQVAQIEQIMSEEGYDELWQARDDIEEKLGIYTVSYTHLTLPTKRIV